MLTTISLGVSVAARREDLVRWIRMPASRLCFPGARNARGDARGLHFEVDLRAPGAAPALVVVDEYLKDQGRARGGLWFETSQVWMWPNRQAGASWHRYTLRENGAQTELDFSWRFMLPGLAGAQVANAMRLNRSIERAAEIYLERLAVGAEENSSALV
ncbi:MAG TPA: hypothetical protein VMZ00_07820 [Sporichthya sp.]|nr:hypothetical protein [Sporichthya sp.]